MFKVFMLNIKLLIPILENKINVINKCHYKMVLIIIKAYNK